MDKRNPFWLILVVTLVFLPFTGHAQEPVVILHTNDLHGQSLAPLGTIVSEQRILHPNLLLLDGGDLFSGTAVSSLFKGKAEQEGVLALGYDALAIGNHDFDFGREVLETSLANGIPWIAANIFVGDRTLAPAFLIKEIDQTRVLIVGLTSTATPRMAFPSNVEGLRFTDPILALQTIMAEQAGNFDLCIVLSHLGYGEDLLLAQKVPGLTAIIGGHSHTLLSTPVRIRDTLIVQTGSSAQYIGKVTISLEEGFPTTAQLIRIEPDTPLHPQIATIDNHYANLMADEMGQIIGHASRDYVKRGMGHFMVEALLAGTGADAALYNGGGVRAGLPRGAVTREDVFAVEPFDNQAIVVTLSGADFAQLVKLKSTRSNDFFSGPKVIDLDRNYTVATSDFLASENSSYAILARGEINHLGKPVRQVLEEYLMSEVLDTTIPASSF